MAWPATVRADFDADKPGRQQDLRGLRDRDHYMVQSPFNMEIASAQVGTGDTSWEVIYDFPGQVWLPGWINGDPDAWQISAYLYCQTSFLGDGEYRLRQWTSPGGYSNAVTVSDTSPSWVGPASILVSDLYTPVGRSDAIDWHLEVKSASAAVVSFPAQNDLSWRFERV